MNTQAILYPVFALALWTALILTLVPVMRFRAAARREVKVSDFRFGESAAVPASVSLPNRNYMNLLELPILFYVVCLLAYVTDGISDNIVMTAWAFVGFRVVHSIVHIAYNNVMHRLAAFTLSTLALLALWVLTFMHVSSMPIHA